MFERFGPDEGMQLYGRGIRRRLAAMLGERPLVELAFNVLYSLPGTPVLWYGDELGMGDDLRLPQRDAVRTPMQWSAEPQRRLHQGGEAVPARGLARPVRLRARERRAPAAARRLAAPLEHADDPAAQGVPGDRLGRLAPAGDAEPGRARAPLRLARRRPPRAPQLRAGGVRGDVRHRGPARRAAVEPHRAGRGPGRRRRAATASRSRPTARPGTGSARSTTRSTRRRRSRARAGRARRGRCRRRGSPRSP